MWGDSRCDQIPRGSAPAGNTNKSRRSGTPFRSAWALIGLALLLGSLQASGQQTGNALLTTAQQIEVTKGSSGTVSFRLQKQPSENVSLTLDKPLLVKVDHYRFSPGQITFTPSNWNVLQTVTVEVDRDTGACVSCEEWYWIEILTLGGEFEQRRHYLPIIVRDPESTEKLVLSTGDVNLPGAGGDLFRVRLQKRPSNDVTVWVTSSDPLIRSIWPRRLTFTPYDWERQQEINFRVGAASGGQDGRAEINLRAAGGGYDGVRSALSVTVDSARQAGFVLSPRQLTVDEGRLVPFTIRLAARPNSTMNLEIKSSDPDSVLLATSRTTGISGAIFTFLPEDPSEANELSVTKWDVPQTIYLLGARDDDAQDESASIIFRAISSGIYGQFNGYAGVEDSIDVTILDVNQDELRASPQSLRLEEGAAGSFSVTLSSRPSSAISATVQSADTGAVTVSPATLNFTQANWNQPQSVTVRAVQDSDTADEQVSVGLALAGGGHMASVSVSVTDEDTPGLDISPASLSLVEGARGTFSVSLETQPSEDISVYLTQPSNTDVKIFGSTELTFTAANWNQGQSVSVVTEQDADLDDEQVDIALQAAGGDYQDLTGSVAVSVQDDDVIKMTVSPQSLRLIEGRSQDFTVHLQQAPNGQILMMVASTDSGAASASPRQLTFTPSNWDDEQTITVTGADDSDTQAESARINLTALGAGFGRGSVAVSVVDDDEKSVVLSSGTLSVEEGSTASFTVNLSSAPSADVRVSVTSASTQTATVSPASLIFTADNWHTGQAVTVTGVEDANAANDEVTVTLAASDGGYDSVSGEIDITAADNDEALLTLSKQSLKTSEGGSGSFGVSLSAPPTTAVTVSIASDATGTATVSPASMTFTAGDWSSPQTVTVSGVSDSNGDEDSANIALSAAGGEYAGVTGKLAVTVSDVNQKSLTLSAQSLSVSENSEREFTVRLTTQPSADVTLSVASASPGAVSIITTSVTFAPDDWDQAKKVVVSGVGDADALDETATVTLSASGGGYDGVNGSVSVTVDDSETPSIILGLVSRQLTVDEGGSRSFPVSLSSVPSGNVTVELSDPDDPDVSLDKTSLTFTPGGWNSPQSVTVHAAEDADQGNDLAITVLRASGGGFSEVTSSVGVIVSDNDKPDLIVSAADLDVAEGGSGSFTVHLATQPSGAVSVSLTRTVNADVTLDRNSLSFTAGNWSAPQTVLVTADEDADGLDEPVEVTLSASGANYAAVTGSVAVNVVDNDRGLVVSASGALTVEEGGSETFTVRLATQPSTSVRVAVAEATNVNISVTPASLFFTTADWSTAKTVTVTASQGSSGASGAGRITLSAAGADYGGVNAALAVSVSDSGRGFIVSASSLTVEEGGSETFTVRLESQPSGEVSVAVVETSNDDVSVSPAALTFSTTDWSTPQTVTVNVAEDDDQNDDQARVRLVASGADYTDVAGSVAVSVTDNDRALVVLAESDPLEVNEGDSSTFTVRLTTRPLVKEISVAVAETSNADVSVSPAVLTFSSTNWFLPQTVTVTAAEDDDGSDDTARITLAASGGAYAGISTALPVSVIDSDRELVIVADSDPLTVNEGDTGAFTVRLARQPTGSVSVAVTETGNADVSVSPEELTFSTTDWSAPQTVTVKVAEDDDRNDDQASVRLAASGADYAGTTAAVAVSVIDNDRELVIEAASDPLTVDEGETGTFTVQLSTLPSGEVRIAVAEADNADVSVSPAELTFSSANWNAAQTVTVTAEEDDDGSDDTARVTLAASGGGYAGISAAVAVSVIDDDRGLVIVADSDPLAVGEGDTGAFTVRLATQPSGSVTVTTSSSAAAVATASPARLSFTAGNWETGQPVTVTATENDDPTDGQATISLSASGGGYGGTTGEVEIAVINNDPAVLLSNQRLSVFEGGEVEFTARLATQPSAAVTVMTSTSSAAVATAAPASLSFTADNWNAAQTVTVTGVEDDNRTDDFATISLAASGAPEYANISASLVTTVRENPDAELVLSAESLSVMEYGQASFGVKLSARPQGDVTVSLSLPTADSQVIRLSSDRLTFTADNWGGEQSVGVTGMPDPHDRANTSVAVTLTATGGGYRGRTAGLTVMVVDAEGVQQEVVEQVLADAAWSNLTSSTSTVASRLDSIPGQRTAVLSGRTVDLGSGRGAETVLGLVQSLGADSDAAAERSEPDRGGGDWLGGIALRDGRPSTKAHSAAQHRGSPSLGRFDYALGDGDGDDTGARIGWSVWGSLDEQDFSGNVDLGGAFGGSPQYDGSQSAIWLGVDRRLDEYWMWGAAFAQSSTEVGYSADSGAQQIEMDLSILLLYGRMSLSGGGSLNAAVGTGWGEMEAVNGYGRRAAADLSLSVISLNGSWPVSRQGRSTLSLTGGLGQGQLNSAGASGGCTSPDCVQDGFRGVNHALTIGDLGAVHTHVSAGVRLTHQGLGGDWSLRPRIEVALRQDMGDGPGGLGMEFSGSAELVTPQERVSLSVDTHSLILHSASEVEQRSGYRLHFRLHPRDAAGRGLSFALGPEWGARSDQGALQREDVFLESRSDPAGSEPSGDRLRTALSATLGYGWG
ncbi:MAG: hypothetical protein ISN29_11070, partial [Gammaproteobacteria bacterium AqS3]|nr:hypothetical protein [Gammaproteobacteria bacterium AqS3]